MAELKITDVRALPGDSAFLIDDGTTSVLCDTGFAFTGKSVAENIKKELGDRKLDYILLTHSHYDHALGSVYIRKAYPNVTVVAGEYAAKIFAKSTARATMRDLDRKFAKTNGVTEYEDLIDELKADVTVNDGDRISCGDMVFTVIALPGHTKCSVGFYLEKEKLLLGSETLGVYFGDDTYLPSYLVGYGMMLDSFKKAKRLDIEKLLIPHYGVVDRETAQKFLENSEKASVEAAEKIKDMFLHGASKDEILARFEKDQYKETVARTYPIDAFRLNTGIMIALIEKECL